MNITLYSLAQRFAGMAEIAGKDDQPFIVWAHSLCGLGTATPDEVAWCSSWLNALAWLLRLPRSKSARARSWLAVGLPVPLAEARIGDVIVFKRALTDPGPDTLDFAGHVALYAGRDGLATNVLALGGNQGEGGAVTVARFPVERILGIRRIEE